MKIFSLAAIQMQNKAGTVLTQASKKEKKKKEREQYIISHHIGLQTIYILSK